MKVFFANDCQTYHGGSWAVSQVIRQQLEAASHEIFNEEDLKVFDKTIVSECDAILVNGEGTIHHNGKRASHLLALLRFGQELGKFTALVNTSWFSMGPEFDDVLQNLDHLSVREILSQRELEANHSVKAELHLDLSYDFQTDIGVQAEKQPVLMTDLYSREFNCAVILNGGARAAVPFINMRKTNWNDTLAIVSKHSCLVTGRFHGLMAALKTRTPFVAYPGKTHKIQGVLETLGGTGFLKLQYKEVFPLALRWKQHKSEYERVFDAAAAMPKWKLPDI